MTLNSTPKKISETAPQQEKTIHGTNLRITVAANQGGRKYMEDRVQIESFRNPDDGSIMFTYLGVYDGHGGYEASEFVRQNLMKNIIDHELFNSDDDKDVREAIRQGFLETHNQIRSVADAWPRTASGFASTAGTTASVAILRNGKLYSGHVGDSAIVLCRRNQGSVTAIRVTIDHKPESEAEQDRIYQAGGQVMAKSGVHRVVWTRPLRGHVGPIRRSTPTENIPFLAVARSLGDLWSYCEATKTFIVSPEPDIEVIELTNDDYCIVLASDGLTNVLHPSQVPTILDEEETSNGEDRSGLTKDPLKQVNHSRILLSAALRNWRNFRADNISAVCVYLDNPSEHSWIAERSLEQKLQLNQSLDEMFCVDPECMIRVAPDRTQKLATFRTPLLYSGTVDANFTSVDYRGPGFITHDEEEEIEGRSVIANNLEDFIDETEVSSPAPDVSLETHQPILQESLRTRSDKRSADSTIIESPCSPVANKKGRSSNKDANGSDEEDPEVQTPTSMRVTRSRTVEMNGPQSEPRNKAVAVRKASQSTPSFSLIKKEEVFSSSTILQISVNESETESTGVVTRSRDRQTTLLVNLSPTACSSTPLAAFQTPGSRLLSVEKNSRKRPRNASSGATPFVDRLSFDSPAQIRMVTPKMRSAPSTPAKDGSNLVGSTWSLSKIESIRGTNTDEPPSKMRKVIGFMKRLVGFGSSEV